MKRRYVLDANSDLLTDRDGNTLGRVVGIVIESGGRGGSSSSLPSNTLEIKEETSAEGRGAGEPKRPTGSQLEAEAVVRVWELYRQLIPSKRKLDDKRKRIIRNAIRLVGEEAVKQAVLGLSRSPWHNGENEQRRRYLEIRYALKGLGDESDDERIEKAISWAAIHSPQQRTVDPDKVARWLESVRYTMSLPHKPERERGVEALKKLRAAGFKVVPLQGPPWARLEER